MPKEGFNGEWIAISRTGKFNDSTGVERNLDEDFFNQIIANFTPDDAPAVVGHPKDNAPAFGWASALRLQNGVLEAQFADVDDQFEQMVREGRFRKRSASFYMSPPRLRHVGFLGAQPPAVKGLRDINFSDGEDSVTVEISFKEQIMEEKDMETVADGLWEKIKSKFSKSPEANAETGKEQTTNFSEADIKQLVADAVKNATDTVTADFTEKLKSRDEQIKSLTESVNANSASGKRTEIISFIENIPAEKGRHFLKNIGIAEFLEECAKVDAERGGAGFVAFSEGEGDKKQEHKFTMLGWVQNLIAALPPTIQFGEKFGNITATGDVTDAPKNLANMNEMRDEMGIKKAGGAK